MVLHLQCLILHQVEVNKLIEIVNLENSLNISLTNTGTKNIIKLIMNKNVLFFDKKSEAEHILDIIKDVYGNDTNFKVVKLNITCNCTFV